MHVVTGHAHALPWACCGAACAPPGCKDVVDGVREAHNAVDPQVAGAQHRGAVHGSRQQRNVHNVEEKHAQHVPLRGTGPAVSASRGTI